MFFRDFRSGEGGQVMVIVAGSMVVLMLATALAVDWGYALTQRRVAQNAVDAGAVAAGRLLIKQVFAGPTFAVTENQVFCAALDFVQSNEQNFGTVQTDPTTRPTELRVQWAGLSKTPWHDLAAYPTWPPSTPGINCTNPGTGSLERNGPSSSGSPIPFDAAARFLRVEVNTTFRALFAGSSVTAGATAIASIHGAPIPQSGPAWPITRHYTKDLFAGQSCGSPCNPQNATPLTFWSSGGNQDGVDYGSFHGLIDYSKYSPKIAANGQSCYVLPPATPPTTCQPQLIEHWDNSGPPPDGRPSLAFLGQTNPYIPGDSNVSCYPVRQKWVTWGDDLSNSGVTGDDTHCSLPNWALKPFGDDPNNINTGRLVLDRPRGPKVDTPAGRAVCESANRPPAPLPSPSCGSGGEYLGDWVETQGANHGSGISDPLLAYVQAYGLTDPVWSRATCEQCPGGQKPLYGKYVVVFVYLWDCAEDKGTGPINPDGGTWKLIEPKTGPADCSNLDKNSNLPNNTNIDRVHLFTVAPFTFYEGLITSSSSSSVRGFWGGYVSNDPNGGALNQFFNAVTLVD